MYSIHDIHFSYHHQTVLDGITLHLSPGEVFALIGKNGSGKTTLLRIAAGELAPEQGSLRTEHERIGYLPQSLETTETVEQFLGESAYQELRIVGLDTLPLDQYVETLSGGQKTKLGLAKLLLGQPTVLLLDEPTNNLDLEGIEWLTSFIRCFPGAVLLTSHDRAFLDTVATRTIELKMGIITLYGGNYSFTRAQQQREREALQARFDAQETYRKNLLEDIATTKAQAVGVELSTTQVNTRRYAKKVARKATVREARLERQMEQTDWLEKPFTDDIYRLSLPETEIASGKRTLEVVDLSYAIAEKEILHPISFQLIGNQRLWLKGANGSGKSTLLNLIQGILQPSHGTITIGPSIRIGAFSQEANELRPKKTARAELLSTNEHPTRCFQFARALGLTMSDLEHTVESLSRGQQAKLAFTKILLHSPHLLILDEPTNHLELEAREAIEGALKNFRGAILVASHDRYFIESLEINTTVSLA
jgi:macrolide transport system ATP-binding/permease protein